MKQKTWFGISLFLILILVGALVAAFWQPTPTVLILPLPKGDQEIVWIHTTTNAATWDRFVTSAERIPTLQVDASRAYLERTTSVPEIVIRKSGIDRALRIRWYKLSSVTNHQKIIQALAERDPPPLAIIGGGSTDRAVDLAKVLNRQKSWQGKPPLLFFTTATANDVFLDDEPSEPTAPFGFRRPKSLLEVYPGRSFRFCFTNQQMAKAVVDFIWQMDHLRPAKMNSKHAQVLTLAWNDDPYSIDLSGHLKRAIRDRAPDIQVGQQNLPYSVGTYNVANRWEAEAAEQILHDLPTEPGSRSLVVVPTTPPPARRLLKCLAGQAPLIGKSLVAVNGDGIGFNTFYRDADIAWPIRDLSIPMVFFMHQNPVAWDKESDSPTGMPLLPPNSTEDVLLFKDMIERIVQSTFSEEQKSLLDDSDQLAQRLKANNQDFFSEKGNRKGGSGEYVGLISPQIDDQGHIGPRAEIQVWRRIEAHDWELVKKLFR